MMESRPDVDSATLARYLAGECTPAESEAIQRWIEADPGRQQQMEALRAGWIQAGRPPVQWNLDAMWARISARMEVPSRATPPVPVPQHRTPWVAIAASLLLVAGAGFWLTRRSAESASTAPVVSPPMREVVTNRGQRAVFNLSDGSRVMLAAESRLRIPAGYNSDSAGGRPLYLEGEAFFVVRHDSTRPFRVHTSSGIAEDIGTEFVVTSYPETQGTRVVVASGAVALRSPLRGPPTEPIAPTDTAPLLTLASGDLALIDTAGIATLTRGSDIHRYLAWTEGTLVFDGTLLARALPEIGRWYDLDIKLADPSLADRRLTATFHNEPPSQVVERIALALNLRVRHSGKTITLVDRGK